MSSVKELEQLYTKNFSIGYFGGIQEKFALISLTCYLTFLLKDKKVTHYQVIKRIVDKYCASKNIPNSFIVKLGIICSDFGYGCKEFITFDLPDKEIPKKIGEIINNYCPF